MNYTGLECPVCGKAFTEQDDIVVCPECGAPHHRECYTAHGRCGCAETHGTDQQWDRCHHAIKKNCPFCQGQNDEDASFCSHCGRPLTEPNTQQQQTPPGGAPRDPGAPYGPGVPFGPSGQPFPGQGAFHISPNDPIEDVTYGDMAKVVRSNVPFYMLVFYRMKNFNRKRFNFAAFLFGPAWFLYRKQYKGGFLYLGINMALSAISILLSKFCAAPVMEAAYQSLGIPSSAIITNDTMNQVVQTIMNMGIGSIILFLLPWITTVASFVLAIIAGVKANKWYMNHCLRTAREVRNTTPSSVEQDALYEKKGGVNIALAMILIAINVALTYVPTLFS